MRRKKRRRQRSVLPLVLLGFAVIFLVTLWVSKRPTIETSGQSVAGPLTKNAPFPKMTIEEASVSDKYYYGQLTDKEKIAYKEVLQGIQTQEKEIRLHLKNVNEVDKIYKYVLNDFPELFWWDGSASITTDANVLQSYPILTPNYQYQGAELEAKKQEIEQSVQACLNGISSEAGEYEKIKYVYEYLIQNTDYNMEAPDNQNIYSVFIHRQSVCAGYSKAAQYLLNRMGVFCIYVTGTAVTKTAPEGQPHAWNLVRCEGEYYNMDTTWGDPVFLQEETAMRSSQISYDYLCCSDEQLFRTHTPEQTVKYPSCTATTYNYYVLNGLYYETYDKDAVEQAMLTSIDEQQSETCFQFANARDYQIARDDILGTLIQNAVNHLCARYGLSEVEYSYQEDETLYKLILYWKYEK